MNRLTEEKRTGPWASLKNKAETKPGAFADYECLMAHLEAVTRLAYYEDLEESGRLKVLPFKIGDTVWCRNGNEIAQYEVTALGLTAYHWSVRCQNHNSDFWVADSKLSGIGKTVFLTREEAEAALKEVTRGG